MDDIRDKSGAPLLSWRVKMLPYLEQNALYNQFRLDEPWDSAHNRALLSKMPSVYRDGSDSAGAEATAYQIITGPNTLFPKPGGAKLSAEAIPDGFEATILVVEADRRVPWTKPDDITYTPGQPFPALSRTHRGGALAAFADGTVRSIPSDTDDATILATPAGKESVSVDCFAVNKSALAREAARRSVHETDVQEVEPSAFRRTVHHRGFAQGALWRSSHSGIRASTCRHVAGVNSSEWYGK